MYSVSYMSMICKFHFRRSITMKKLSRRSFLALSGSAALLIAVNPLMANAAITEPELKSYYVAPIGESGTIQLDNSDMEPLRFVQTLRFRDEQMAIPLSMVLIRLNTTPSVRILSTRLTLTVAIKSQPHMTWTIRLFMRFSLIVLHTHRLWRA